jgi:hypothetical protein
LDEIPLVRGLRELAFDVSVLVVYTAGLVASLAYWRRFPRPCFMVFAGSVLLLVTDIGSTFALSYLVQALRSPAPNDRTTSWLLPTVVMARTLARGAGIGLIVAAAFTARSGLRPQDASGAESRRVPRDLRLGLVAASALLYLVSLSLPAVYVSAPGIDTYSIPSRTTGRIYRGFECLVELPRALAHPAWWSNPVLGIGVLLVLRGYTVVGGICGLIALFFGLSYCLGVPRDFRYGNEPVRVGYWFWVAAMAVLSVSAFCRRFAAERVAAPDPARGSAY